MSRQTALGAARSRFLEALPRKSEDLEAALTVLAAHPSDARAREDLRRRFHALYASAQVFRMELLANALGEAIARLDEIRAKNRLFEGADFETLSLLVERLPSLGDLPDTTETSVVAPLPKNTLAAVKASQPPPKRAPSTSGRALGIRVLILDTPEWQARIRAALPARGFEVLLAENVEKAIKLARSGAPDLILADAVLAMDPDARMISRLRDDPLTDFVPVVFTVGPGQHFDPIDLRERGAEEALSKPFEADALVQLVRRVTDLLGGPRGVTTLSGDLTVEEIADRMAEEIRRGLVEATSSGRELAVPLGDGTSLMAATWAAIGQIRSHLAERSGGRVAFQEGRGRAGPAVVSLAGEYVDGQTASDDVSLAGKRVIVVDDDPAIVWFFAGLLREHAVDVVEVQDGVEALEEARRHPPDLIISDILMPRLNGFGLTRALQRDPFLIHVPVILLSWKDDFLQRMRELKAGAAGYLRKEAAATKIIACVRDVLKSQCRLDTRLRAGGSVRGRLDDLGVVALLKKAVTHMPNARLTVRDSRSLFELDIREGELVDLTRTASDGSFLRGDKALPALVGVTAGVFTLSSTEEPPARRTLSGELNELLRHEMMELAARIDALSGRRLALATEVEFDVELLRASLETAPEQVRRITEAIQAGEGPRALLFQGRADPHELEDVLTDLARQGVVRRVFGAQGEDRIMVARARRQSGEDLTDNSGLFEVGPFVSPSTRPAPLSTVSATGESSNDELDRLLYDLETAARSDQSPEQNPTDAVSTKEGEITVPSELFGRREEEELEDLPSDTTREERDAVDEAVEERLSGEIPLPVGNKDPLGLQLPTSPEIQDAPPPVTPVEAVDAAMSEPSSTVPTESYDEPVPGEEEAPELLVSEALPAGLPRHRYTPHITFAILLMVCASAGFIGYRHMREPEPSLEDLSIETATEHESSEEAMDEPSASAETSASSEEATSLSFERFLVGREVAGIATVDTEVADGQGLLVLEPSEVQGPAEVQVGPRRIALRDAPLAIALSQGVHHITLRRGGSEEHLFVAIRAGNTRYVPSDRAR